MIPGSTKRLLWFVALIICSGVAVYVHAIYGPGLPRFTYLSGWALVVLMLVLTLYNGRKKIPFLPLLSSQAWLQFHIYAGLFTGVLFGIHINYRLPTGWFEITLAWLYLLVMISGIGGLVLSRTTPKRLTTFGGEVIFERIPAIRHQCKINVERLALQSVTEARSPAIADFYVEHLKAFFEGPCHVWLHVWGSRRPLNVLLNKMENLNRYLNAKERETLSQVIELVRQKDGLDYHYALQLALKGWLFVHIPLTYSLLLFTLVHIILVFAFSGGAG
jgi:hypothetical protein